MDIATTPPTVTVGIPTGLDPEAIRRRKAALIAAGTDPLLAEKLATDAEEQQALRDLQLKAEVSTVEVPVVAEVAVVTASPDAAAPKASPDAAAPKASVKKGAN